MHMQRIGAIFEKDMKDFTKNMMLLMMPIIPIILALLFSKMGGDERMPLWVYYLLAGAIFSGVTASCMMTMMAEENEKNTLRGLIQSPASFVDILIGKSLVTGLMTLVTLVVSFFIVGFEPFANVRALLGFILLFLFFLLLAIGIGLFAKSVAATSPYLMPIMFLFGFTPFIDLLGLDKDSLVIHIANAFPILQLMKMHDTHSWLPLGIVAIWVVGAALFTWFCFKKTRTDD